ncbi:hypothetical protein ABHM95_02385 [Solibacillus isronensis]|nr:hypothetical protein [Solibacillus isronensis]
MFHAQKQIGGFLATTEYNKFNKRQKQDVLDAVNALSADDALTDL